MDTSPILEEIHVVSIYDDNSFIKEDHSRRMHPNDPTRAAVFPAETDRGTKFEPFHIEKRNFRINTLPSTPLQLFQLFLPTSLVEKWVRYTKIWITWLKDNGVINSWMHPMTEKSAVRKWEGTSVAEVYTWLAILIYMGVHKERTIRSHWSPPNPGTQRPEHSFIKFMPYWKFQLIHRHLRPFDHNKIDETAGLPKEFQAADEWSDHIQAVSAEIFTPGSHLAVDECMVGYTGRSNATTVVHGKPDPIGFKVWVIAQQGFFIRWLWHIKDAKYGAVGVEIPPSKSSTRGRGGQRGGRGRGARKVTGKRPGAEDKPVAMNSTQSVVIALANMLPKATYHVFVDNLFLSSDLFRSLRRHGYGATGTARPNCGIHKELKQDKNADGGVKTSYEFNTVKVIPTPDNQVPVRNAFSYKFPPNSSSRRLTGQPNSLERQPPCVILNYRIHRRGARQANKEEAVVGKARG
jgi:hypothetical protein